MALAFSFIIQNDMLYSLKNKENIKSIWPIKLKNIQFEKIQIIQSSITYVNDLNFHRLYSMFYHHMYNQHVNNFSKYRLLQQTFSNYFYEDCHKKTFLDFFCKYQRVYFGFCKLAKFYKFKKIKSQVSYDLCLNILNENSKNVITVLLDNRKYLFSLTDVVNIFHNALTNMNYMIALPVALKNPYTNNPFPVSILYNMYFFLKERLNMVPTLIEAYFRCNLDLNKFMMLYDNYIQDFALENYVKTTTLTDLLDGLSSMLNERTMSEDRIKVHPCFPQKELLEIMKPYLILYYKSKYSRTSELANQNFILLKNRLHEFFIYNPNFGTIQTTKPNGEIVFNKKVIPPKKHLPPKIYNHTFLYNENGLQNISIGSFRNRRMGNTNNNWFNDDDLSDTDSTIGDNENNTYRI